MHIFSLIAGILGLGCLALTVPLDSGLLPAGGLGLSLLALATGVLRRRQKLGRIGLLLGVIGVVAAVFGFMHLSFSEPPGGGRQPVGTPAPR